MKVTGQLGDFIRSQIRSRSAEPASDPPNRARCLQIDRVSTASIAAELGLMAGDLVLTIDGQPATDKGPGPTAAGARWEVFSRPRSEVVRFETTGIDLGVELWRTTEAMAARGEATPRELEEVWRRGDWRALEELSKKRVAVRRDDPALAFLGAAMIETGRQAEGEVLTTEFARRYTSHWTMCYTAVALYYGGVSALRQGDEALGLELLAVAYKHEGYDRIATAIEKATGRRPPRPRPRWEGQPFPVDYTLVKVGQPGTGVRLFSELDAMARDQVMIVCLLSEHRGNGPYDELMRRYQRFATELRPYVRGLHVLTATPDRPRDKPQFFVGEDAVRAAGLPIELLLDARTAVADPLGPKGSPHVFVIGKDRRVLHEGMLQYVDLWDALRRVGAPPASPASAVGGRGAPPPVPSDLFGRSEGGLGDGFAKLGRLRWVVALGAIVTLPAGLRACARPHEQVERSAMAPAGAARARVRELFKDTAEVYLQVTPQTVEDAESARAKRGKLTEADVRPQLTLQTRNQMSDGRVQEVDYPVVHTRAESIMRGTGYEPRSPTQVLELARDLPRSGGLIVDGSAIGYEDVVALLDDLPRKKPVPFDIRKAGAP